MTLAERIAQQLGVQTDRYMFGLFGDEKSGAGGFGKLQILGKTKHVTRCQNCGRAGLKHAVVCAVVGEDGHPTNQYYYFGSDCASKLAGKAEKDIDAEAEEQEQAGRPRMKKLKPVKPNEGQMELGLRFAAQWHSLLVERYGRPKPAKGQMGLDFDALSSSAQPIPQPQEAIPAVTTQQPAVATKGRQMGLFEQPAAAETASKPSGFEEQKHPRWEAGDKQHHGGQFAPKEHKSEGAIENPPFRDFRYVPKHRNAGSLYPNRPGQVFTDEQQQQLKNWARQNGMMVSSDSGPGAIHVVHNDHRARLDLTLHGAEGVKRETAEAKSKQAAEQESARKQQAEAGLAGRESAGFINEAFGDSLNTYNKTKLADFLEGKDKKFGGLWSRAHVESLQKLGAIDSTGQVNFDAIRKAFEQHGKAATASGPQEPAKPDLQAIAAEARAAGGNLWVTAKKHGIGITHPQASELAKVFQGMGEAEKPQAGAGQLRGQAKFNETRAQEESKAQYFKGDEIRLTGKTDGDFEEFEYLEGHKKGQKGLRLSPAASEAQVKQKQQEWKDQQAQFARLHQKQEEPKAAEGHEPYEHERYPGKWLVPSKAGVQGFGDTLHSSKEEAIAESHRVAKRLNSQQEAAAKAESDRQAEAERKSAFKASGLTPAQAALQGRVQAHLSQQVSAQGNITTRQALLDKELAEGHKPTVREVPDEAARAKAAKEAEFMLKRGVPTGNESHPDTIKLRELQAKAKSAMKQEHVMEKGDGVYRPLSKMEHDYAASKYQPKAEGKEQPVALPTEQANESHLGFTRARKAGVQPDSLKVNSRGHAVSLTNHDGKNAIYHNWHTGEKELVPDRDERLPPEVFERSIRNLPGQSPPAAPKQDDFEGLVDTPAETTKPSGERPTFGDLVKAPDGTVGIMRGDNGLGGNRAGVIDQDGNRSWQNRDELKPATEADLPEGKTLADMPTQMRQPGAPQQPAKPEPEAPKPAGSNIEYRVRHDLPPKERIARYLRAHLKPGDEIDVGGNSPVTIKRVNAKSVTTEGGATWEYGSFKPVGLDLKGMSEKLEQFEKMGGLEAHLMRTAAGKAIKAAVLKSDSDPLAKTLTEDGLKQVREAKTAHLGFVAEQLAKHMPGMDRAAIRQAILDHRKAAGIVEEEAGERTGPIQVAVKSQVPTVDEIEHALQHIESNETGTRFIERNPDTGEVRWAHHESKNAAVNNFINRQRSKLSPSDYVRVRGNYKSWLKSHGTDENKLLGVDPKAAKAKQQEAISKASMTLADFAKHMNDLDDGKVSADEHKAAFARFRDSLPGLEAEISKMKKEDIEGWTHEPGMRIMGRSASKKAEAVQDLLRRMKSSFDVRGETNRWTYGQDREKQLHDAVAGITDDHIKEYTEGVAQVRAERAERQKKREESLANPQTFDDWKRKAIMSGGWEKLSPEHQAAYDESYAQHRREKFPSKLEKPREVSAFAGGQEKTGEVGIVKGHHQKRNAPTWTVTVQEHLGDSWKEALSRAKQLGGNYVNARIARAYGATPGFQFFDEEAAKKFHAVLGGQSVDNSDKIEARAAERAENVAGKLADLSERLAERGEDSLNRDRKDNTARRARMASSAEDDARKQLAKAKTLAKVADHITSGKAVHLKHVSNGAQVDQLDKLLYRSQINAIQKRQRAGERVSEDDWERPASLEDIAHAEYPYPYLHKSELRDQAAALAGVPGLKMFAAKLGKMAAEMPYDRDYAQIKDLGDLEKIQEAIPKMRRHPDHNVRRIATRFAEKLEDMNRLQRIDIRSTPELRAALREYHTMKQEPEGRDPLKEHLRYLKRQKIDGFFPTPPPLIEKMLDHADIGEGMSVLEPSAGIGSIMAAIRENHPDAELHGIEQYHDIAKALELQGLPHERGDFLQHDKKYDRIVMNPPFENRQDEKHVKHAYNLLKPGGRLVAIMGAGAHQNERSAGFRDWLSLMGGKVYDTPEGSFAGDDAFRQTGVRTKMVIIDKPAEETERHSLADEARELRQRVQRIVERYSAAHGFEELLARAAKYRVKGQGYNRNIHTSASRLDDMLSQGRHKEAAHWADELRLRLDAIEPQQPKLALNLFGEPVKPASKPPASFDAAKAKQGILFAGLNAKEGQMNLFADAGVPDDLVAKPQQPAQKELFSAVREALVERFAYDPGLAAKAADAIVAQPKQTGNQSPTLKGAGPAWTRLNNMADSAAGKVGQVVERVDQTGKNLLGQNKSFPSAAKPSQPKSKLAVRPSETGVKAGAPLIFNADHSMNGGESSFPKGTQGKLVGGHEDPSKVVVDVNGQHHAVPKSVVWHDTRHTDHKAVEKSQQEAQQAQAERAQKFANMTARQQAEAIPEGAEKAKRITGNFSSHELQEGDIIHHGLPGLPPFGRVISVSADKSGNPDGKHVVIETAMRSKSAPDGIATTGQRATIPGHEKIGEAVASRSFPVQRMPDEAKPIGQRKQYQQFFAQAKSYGFDDDTAHNVAMDSWNQANPKPKSAESPKPTVKPAAAPAAASADPKPRHHVSRLQAGDTIRMLSGPESEVNLRYVGAGSRPGFITVEHPQLGKQEIPTKSAGLRMPKQASAASQKEQAPEQAQTGNQAKPRSHVSNLQKGDVLSYLSGAEKGQRVRFVSRSDKPGHVIVNTPEKGNHELPVRSLGLYSSPVLTPFTKARAASLMQKNDGMQPQEAIRQARLERGNRRAPDVHQVPRSEFAQYRHGILAKDKQGNGFLLHGGKRYPLSPAEFDGNKLISDPVKIRERIHRDQVKSVAASNPNVVPPHVRDEYDHHWSKWTGNSLFAKSGAKASAAPAATATEPAATTEPSPEGKKGSTLIGMPLNTPAGNAGVGRNTPPESRFGEWKGGSPLGKGGRILKGMNQNPQDESSILPSLPIQGMAIKRPDGSLPEAAGQSAAAPESQPAPQPPKRNLASITRPFNAGANRAMIQFDSELQRDLHDLAAARSFKLKHSGNVDGRQPKSQQALNAKLSRIANQHFGGDEDAASLAAMETLNHVKRHMKGVQDGEHRIVPPLGVEAPKPATPSSQSKQKIQASIKKAIEEARNSDAGGKHQIEHEILRTLPFGAEAFHPDVLPQIIQMVKEHIHEFHAPKRMEAEKLADAWRNARVKMGVGRDERKGDARKKLEQMRNGEIDASSKQLKHMDLIGDHLREHFPNRFSEDEGTRNMQLVDFLAGDSPRIPQPHDSDLIEEFWAKLDPGYKAWLKEIANGAPFNREEWGGVDSHMPPPDDYEVNDFNHFSASGNSIVERFSAVWSTKEFFNGQSSYGKRSGFAANRSGKAKKGSA